MMAVAPGCGDNVCVIINTGNATLEWIVIFAVSGSKPIGAIEADMVVDPCNGICDCHDGCGCGDRCDCSARFAGELAELDCEPLVDATYRGTLDDDGAAHIALVVKEALSAPAEFLSCNYRSATEPLPSHFRVVVTRAANPPAEDFAQLPAVVVVDISLR